MAGVYSNNSAQTYQTKAVFVSSGSANSDQLVSGGIRQLSRIQDTSWDITYPLQQPTYVDGGADAYYPNNPSLSLSLSYLHSNGRNEQALGLLDTVGVGGALALNLDEEKAVYISVENTPGIDAVGAPTGANQTVLGFAQGLMTNYQLSAAIGGLVQAHATMECLSAVIYTASSGDAVPAFNPQNGLQLTGLFALPQAFAQYDPNVTGLAALNVPTAAIGYQDMYLLFPVGTPFGITFNSGEACYLQSFQVGFNIPRKEDRPLGNVYPNSRGVLYPIEVNLSTEALVNRYQRDQLDRLDCPQTGFSINVVVKQPCSNVVLFGLYFDNLKLVSQSFTSSIGPMDAVNLQWRGLITSPSTVFFNPGVNFLYNLNTTGAWGTTW